jgi:rod shape-determining protein MreB
MENKKVEDPKQLLSNILKQFFSKILFIPQSFSQNLAIDLGTANTLIYQQNKDIILNEPSMVAIMFEKKDNYNKKKVIAVGNKAKTMLGKTPEQITVVRPMRDGVIADFEVTEEMIKYFIRQVNKGRSWFSLSPVIVICVPCGSTQVERRAIKDSVLAAGARRVELLEEAMAAAIGAGLPVASPRASMVVDIGGGTTEIGVISLGGLVYSNSIKVAGNRIDETIVNYIKTTHGLLIGDTTAEEIKKNIASAHESCASQEMTIRGRNIYDGLPKSIVINSTEIRLALSGILDQIISGIKNALNVTPPELSADLIEAGIVLTGGGALLKGIDTLINEQTQISVIVADDPLFCVVKGCGITLDQITNRSVKLS